MPSYHQDAAPVTLARLIAIPTVDTVRKFRDRLSQPPLKLDPLETFHVTVCRAYSQQQASDLVDLESAYPGDQVFPFRFRTFDYVYDEVLHTSKILGEIVSPGLEAVRIAYDSPHSHPLTMQFLHSSPPLSRAIKSFVVSVADTLILKESEPFTLQGLFFVREADYHKQFKAHYIGLDSNAEVR